MMDQRMPHWPAAMTADTAATYLGRSRTTFLNEWKAGIWPNPWKRGRVVVWLKSDLDDCLEIHGRRSAPSNSIAERVRERLTECKSS